MLYTHLVITKFLYWLCSIAVSVSLGAMVLLPASIISNEIRHLYPDSVHKKKEVTTVSE